MIKEYSFKNKNITEGIIGGKVLPELLKDLPVNVREIWVYAFSEIVNNALEHSKAENIYIKAICSDKNIKIIVKDDGIGIFNSIATKYNLIDINDAVFALFKGKITTAPFGHSGEGIFYTSRVMDSFYAAANGKIFSFIRKQDENSADNDICNDEVGTQITMVLSNTAKQKLSDVFDAFTTELAFDKTEIPVKRVADFSFPVSRSEGRRLVFGLERFKIVILDFEGVEMIGQGFAHEVFNVFGKAHPEVKFKCINLVKDVEKMIKHVGGVYV